MPKKRKRGGKKRKAKRGKQIPIGILIDRYEKLGRIIDRRA